jgi:hypothetical protein
VCHRLISTLADANSAHQVVQTQWNSKGYVRGQVERYQEKEVVILNEVKDLLFPQAPGSIFMLQSAAKDDQHRDHHFPKPLLNTESGLRQCVGFKMPLVFSESREVPANAYVADLYEQVSFLGDLHRQIARSPR